jgi:hypothetical protein
LPGTSITISNAGAPHATLVAIVVLFSGVALLVGPSFLLLFMLQTDLKEGGDDGVALPPGLQDLSPSAARAMAPLGPADWISVLGLVAVSGIVHAVVHRHKDR